MKLKDYQNDVLDGLSGYLRALEARRQEAEEFVEFQRGRGRAVPLGDYCRDTWDGLNAENKLPRAKDKQGNEAVLDCKASVKPGSAFKLWGAPDD